LEEGVNKSIVLKILVLYNKESKLFSKRSRLVIIEAHEPTSLGLMKKIKI